MAFLCVAVDYSAVYKFCNLDLHVQEDSTKKLGRGLLQYILSGNLVMSHIIFPIRPTL